MSLVGVSDTSRILATMQWRAFSAFEKSHLSQDKLKMRVPTMGDSITEGTIVEWSVNVGQTVKEGDVVCMIETDKVTVDIKAEVDGVILSLFGAVDDTVSVGSDLYQIDTDGVQLSGAEASDTMPAAASTINTTATAIPEHLGSTSHRIPSIHFLGKAGWAKKTSSSKVNKDFEISTNQVQHFSQIQLEPDDLTWNPMYGRPPVSEDEIESLAMGGASKAPRLLRPSSGAIFG